MCILSYQTRATKHPLSPPPSFHTLVLTLVLTLLTPPLANLSLRSALLRHSPYKTPNHIQHTFSPCVVEMKLISQKLFFNCCVISTTRLVLGKRPFFAGRRAFAELCTSGLMRHTELPTTASSYLLSTAAVVYICTIALFVSKPLVCNPSPLFFRPPPLVLLPFNKTY